MNQPKPASTRQITEVVCFVKGHKIVSLVTKQVMEPSTKTLVPVYEVLCQRCGLDINKIRNYRPYFSREDIRQRKEAKNHVNNPK